jgi:type IV secretion system protein VirB1
MILDVATLLSLAGSCAPTVAPETLISIVHTESRFNSLAIGVNSPGVRAPKPATKAQAIAAARSLIGQGYNIDLGLGQINSANLGWLGLSVENAFEPCSNLAAAARVIATNYQAVARLARAEIMRSRPPCRCTIRATGSAAFATAMSPGSMPARRPSSP